MYRVGEIGLTSALRTVAVAFSAILLSIERTRMPSKRRACGVSHYCPGFLTNRANLPRLPSERLGLQRLGAVIPIQNKHQAANLNLHFLARPPKRKGYAGERLYRHTRPSRPWTQGRRIGPPFVCTRMSVRIGRGRLLPTAGWLVLASIRTPLPRRTVILHPPFRTGTCFLETPLRLHIAH